MPPPELGRGGYSCDGGGGGGRVADKARLYPKSFVLLGPPLTSFVLPGTPLKVRAAEVGSIVI